MILVIGDSVLDVYTEGVNKRVNPEGDIPLIDIYSTEYRLGAAANVAANISSLGCPVTLISRIGNDPDGVQFTNLLDKYNIDRHLIIRDSCITILKERVFCNGNYFARLDREVINFLSLEDKENVLQSLPEVDVKIVILSDYNKGFFDKEFFQKIAKWASCNNVLVITDPKGHDITMYDGAWLITPNRNELLNLTKTEDIDEGAKTLLRYAKNVLVTQSEDGMTLYNKDGKYHFNALFEFDNPNIRGAGDLLCSAIAVGLKEGKTLLDSLDFANRVVKVGLSKSLTPVVSRKELNE